MICFHPLMFSFTNSDGSWTFKNPKHNKESSSLHAKSSSKIIERIILLPRTRYQNDRKTQSTDKSQETHQNPYKKTSELNARNDKKQHAPIFKKGNTHQNETQRRNPLQKSRNDYKNISSIIRKGGYHPSDRERILESGGNVAEPCWERNHSEVSF